MTKVTVYIPVYNYGRFVDKAIQSVLAQSMDGWELIVINDGSTDNTNEVLAKYRQHPKIKILEQENRGLNTSNNIAIRLSRGEYIIRLDADDYFDENILVVLSNVLDNKPNVGLVYPDYYHVDEKGKVLEVVRRKKIGEEVELLDLPAHGACTMFRKSLLRDLGGYSEDYFCQDGYEIWIRIIQKHKPYNVNIPLFYYRQHSSSLTGDQKRIIETRREIKKQFVNKHGNGWTPKVVAIVPVVGSPPLDEMKPFNKLNGEYLLWHTLREAQKSRHIDKVVVSSDDDEVLNYAKKFDFVLPIKRPVEYTKTTTKMSEIAKHVIKELPKVYSSDPEAICILYINTPLRRYYHIDKAIDTMIIFDVDSVISVEEDLSPCYQHAMFGLTPINGRVGNIRLERKSLFRENGAIYLTKVEGLNEKTLLGRKVGHIIMLSEESIKINSAFDFWLAEKVMKEWAIVGK